MMKKVPHSIVLGFCSLVAAGALTGCAANQTPQNYADSVLSLRGYTPKPGYDEDQTTTHEVAPAQTKTVPEFIHRLVDDDQTPPPPPPPPARKKPALDPLDAS